MIELDHRTTGSDLERSCIHMQESYWSLANLWSYCACVT